MTKLEEAIKLAVLAHEGQTYGYGAFQEPKIMHPIEVMFRVREMYRSGKYDYLVAGYTEEELMIAAMLHDTVEDTQVTLKHIESVFGPRVTAIVDAITRRKDEKYRDFIYRIKRHKAASFLKLADLAVNMSHNHELPEDKKSLLYRYQTATRVLTEEITWEQASAEVRKAAVKQ